jgi:hypothetical protein
MHGFPFGSTFQTTVLIPFDQIQSCRVVQNSSCCGIYSFASSSVGVQSSADASTHSIVAVKESQAFVDLVQAMMVSMDASSPAAAAMGVSLSFPEAQAELISSEKDLKS